MCRRVFRRHDLEEIRSHALNAYRLLGCRDFARIDFRMDAAGRPRFLECNPLPGLHPESSDIVILSRKLWPEHELAYDGLVQGILRDAARALRCQRVGKRQEGESVMTSRLSSIIPGPSQSSESITHFERPAGSQRIQSGFGFARLL